MTSNTNFTLLPIDGTTYINDTNKDYGLYTATNRAIPSAWDGVKDGNRKALYVLRNKTKEIKTISLAGELISSGLYLHGDASAAEAIGKMAAPFQNSLPLISGIGGFGTRKDPAALAAPRYTYVQQSAVTKKVVYPDMDIIPMKENYDGSTMEPTHFLPIIPVALLNGIEGMAVGFSTNILPHSFSDLVTATLKVLDGELPSLTPKYDCFNGDYPEVLGPNHYEFLGNAEVVDAQSVLITNLPPGISREKILEKIYDMEDDTSNAVKSSVDDSSNTEISILVKFTRGYCKDWTSDDAIDFFKLYKKNKQRLVMVNWDNKTIRHFRSAEEYVIEFVENRFTYYIKRYEKAQKDTQYKLHQWELVKKCYDDNLPGMLKNFNSKKELVQEITSINKNHSCGADKKQIENVAGLPTYRWVKDHYQDVLDKIDELQADIDYYTELLSDHDLIWQIYKEEVQELQTLTFETGREEV